MRVFPSRVRHPEATLRAIKLVHTAVWAFFGGCVVAIPVAAALGAIRLATWLIAIVMVEVLILAVNHFHCPLTDVAARYTLSREDNFDIYLPAWLARYNKVIFGSV